MTKGTEMVSLHILMELPMMGNGKMIRKKDMEFTFIRLVASTKETSTMTVFTERASVQIPMDLLE